MALNHPAAATDNSSINWKLCCLCQKVQMKKLSTPSKVMQAYQNGSGYKILSQNLHKFKKFGTRIEEIDTLDNGCSLEETLKAIKATYHKSCQLKYSDDKV